MVPHLRGMELRTSNKHASTAWQNISIAGIAGPNLAQDAAGLEMQCRGGVFIRATRSEPMQTLAEKTKVHFRTISRTDFDRQHPVLENYGDGAPNRAA
jgi:hypothetical protein